MEYKVGGARPIPNPEQYQAFDINTHVKAGTTINYGSNVDMRSFSVERHNQGQYSCCTCEATTKALEIKRVVKYYNDFLAAGQSSTDSLKNARAKHVPLSVLSLYYGARDKMTPPETDVDQGTFIGLVADTLKTDGVCEDKLWPFDATKLYLAPSILADRSAYLNKINTHFRLNTSGDDLLKDIETNLQCMNPVIFFTSVGKDFMAYNSSSSPLTYERYPEGNHALCIVGIDGDNFIIENSWGEIWGYDGFCYMNKNVVIDPKVSGDHWVIISGSEDWLEGK